MTTQEDLSRSRLDALEFELQEANETLDAK